MALAEKLLATQYNRDGAAIVDHHTYCSSATAASWKASRTKRPRCRHLKLGKLIVFYDDNGISIDGKTVGWFSDDTPKRFKAYGWHVVKNVDGHDADAVAAAIKKARIARISRRSSAARPSSAGVRLTSRVRSRRTARHSVPTRWPSPARRSAGMRRRS